MDVAPDPHAAEVDDKHVKELPLDNVNIQRPPCWDVRFWLSMMFKRCEKGSPSIAVRAPRVDRVIQQPINIVTKRGMSFPGVLSLHGNPYTFFVLISCLRDMSFPCGGENEEIKRGSPMTGDIWRLRRL